MEAMPSDGLRRRRRHHRHPNEAKTIHVKMLTGRTLKLQLNLSETIANAKARIYEQEGTHPMQQLLIFSGQQLDDDHRTLADYGVPHGPSSALYLIKLLQNEGTRSHRMKAMASEGLRCPSQREKKTVLIKDLSGEITKLELDLSETIPKVKAMIYEKEGTHPVLQRLIFNGRQANNNYCTLEEYGFQYGTLIFLVHRLAGGRVGKDSPQEINIFVRKLDGGIFTVRLRTLESPVYDVRHTIRLQEGIRQTQQHLVFCGQPLDDDRTLADYNIQENSTLHLAPGPRGGNSGLHEDGDGLVKTGQATGTNAAAVDESSNQGHDQEGSQSQALVLCHDEGRNEQIMEANREITDMVVNDNEEFICWPKTRMCAPFHVESTGSHVIEDMPSDGLLCRRRRRRTEVKTIRVECIFRCRTFSLQLDLSETIAEVKAMIHEQERIHPMQQVLIFRGQRLNNDHLTLADYGVQHGLYVFLLLGTRRRHPPENDGTGAHRMKTMASEGLRRPSQGEKTVLIENLKGEITKLELELSETIDGVMDMIYEKEGTHPEIQRLLFNGLCARIGFCTLEEYGFQYGTIIYLLHRLEGGSGGPGPGSSPEINIFVRKLDGKIFTVRLRSLMTPVYDIRHTIRLQEGIRQTQQHLVFCGQPLDDDSTLAYYNIQENSTLHLAPGPCGGNSSLHEDQDGLIKTGLAAGTYAAAVDEGCSHSHDQEWQSSGSQSQSQEGRNEQIMEASIEITEEPPSMAVNDTVPLVDEFIKQQQERIRWSKYSVKALVFAITTLVTYLGSASTLFSTGNMVFKISIGAFFMTNAMLSIMMPPKIGSILVYLSCFLLVFVSYLLLVSFNKYYGYAILPVLLPIIAALLQHKLLPGLMPHQRANNSEGDHTVDIEVPGQAHGAGEEDSQHFDRIFELSADIVNCGGLITVVFGNSMVGPVSAVGFLFFYTMSLGLYLMMVTTVRTAVLTAHARYLAILLNVLLVITLITALIHGVHR